PAHQIPVVVDLPGVGQNFHDHAIVNGLTWSVNKGSATSGLLLTSPTAFKDFVHDGQGPLTSSFGLEANAWTVTEEEEDPGWPDLQYTLSSLSLPIDHGVLYHQYFKGLLGQEGITICPSLTRPKSRGSVKLRSRDFRDPPLIDPNYLSHPDDVTTLVRGIEFALKVANTTALRDDHGAKFHDQVLPGCERWWDVAGWDSYWACYVRHMTTSFYHPAGSCKMGPASDLLTVVDHTLRVRGVAGLRVVDASIMPVVVSGNINAAVIMIGEKGADLIKQDWGATVDPL
ncbi:Glucose dehydrogenase [FAD quinone]-like 2, partial [Homarus americanus]